MSQNVVVILLSLMLFISNLFGGSPTIMPPQTNDSGQEQAHTISGRVRSAPITLYDAPSRNAAKVGTGPANTSVVLLAEDGDWYKIQLPDGTTGWALKLLISSAGTPGILAKEVYGYFVHSTNLPSLPSLQTNFHNMTGVTPWSFSLDAAGNLLQQMDAGILARTLQFAGEKKLDTLALVSNYDKQTESFSGELAHTLLKNPANRRQAVESIYRTLKDWGFSGVNIDFEHVYPTDREHYSQFLRDLKSRLQPAGLLVTVAIPAKTFDDPKAAWSGAFDYKAIGQTVDRMMIMAYDQHYTGGAPGPIASIEWVEQVLKFAVSQAPREKVVLGVAGYGYSWQNSGSAYSVTYQRAVELAAEGGGVQWDSTHQAPFAYHQGREMWFENAASISHKLDLVNKYGIKGIALWRLGQEDPQVWSVVGTKLSS
ncbi:MAG: SH3 domain-containing protein [Firmicutes bacterium]|nr:SH3 domain-containing protein [Bacillota bacterium]